MSNEYLKKMPDEELDKVISEKYGEDWDPANFEKGDPLANEFFRRISMAAEEKMEYNDYGNPSRW